MTKRDKLNIASDLKRIAYWLAVGDRTKIAIIGKLWREVGQFLPKGQGLKFAFGNKKKRLLLAEDLLLTSIRLQYN